MNVVLKSQIIEWWWRCGPLIKGCAVIAAVFPVGLLFAVAACERLSLRVDLAEIASVREALGVTRPEAAGVLVDRVARLNAKIASHQLGRRWLIGRIAIPSEWDNVQLIAIPEHIRHPVEKPL